MVSFSFQKEFVPLIEDGRKQQAIRSSMRCVAGDTMHLFTGLRTKECRTFFQMRYGLPYSGFLHRWHKFKPTKEEQ